MSDEWWPENYSRPAFQVQRDISGTATGGDFVRGSGVLSLAHTALRYPTGSPASSAVADRSILHAHTVNHSTVQIEWGWPPAPNDTWLEMSLVRSAFGRPSTVNDGVTIYRKTKSELANPLYPSADGTAKPLIDPILTDVDLPPGRWYYYAIFFKMTPLEWVRGMADSCLVPRDLQHDEHLWDNVPPYYRWVDGEQSYREGRLRQFLNVFGFELDQTREFVESWQHLYDADWSPIRLLRKLGPNFGIEYESGLGDIRFRSLMTDIGHLYKTRGTPPSLELLVHNMSKYACKVTPGISLMLTPDDSDFFTGTGSWAGLHPQMTSLATTVATPDKVLLAKAPVGEVTQPQGRGALEIWTTSADATANVSVNTGCGIRYPNNNGDPTTMHEILPHDYGIPTEDGVSYGFSVSVMVSAQPITVTPYLLFFDKTGMPYNPLLTVKGNPVGISDLLWHTYLIKGTAPAGATFVVPGLLFTDRPAAGPSVSPSIYLAGVLVYVAGDEGEVLGVPPDRYLTMGDPSELLGTAKAGFDPFLLGTPS